MNRDELRITLDALREEAGRAEVRVQELQVDLDLSQQRLQHLRGAVQNIQFIVGDEPSQAPSDRHLIPSQLPDAGITAIHGRVGAEDDADVVKNDAPQRFTLPESTGVKRTPSTEWMIEVVNHHGRAMTREEAFEAYRSEKGIPESWTNPRTAMANALARAVKNGKLQQLSGDRYAPLEFDPFAVRPSPQNDGPLGLEEQ